MWQFFGRKEILSELKFLLEFEEKPEERSFSALLILGRRGVGKTELLSQIEQRVPSNLPYVYVELPDPDKIPDSGDVAIDLLIKEASRSGLDIANLLPERGPYDSTTIWFGEILAALLRMGAIVVLDEFHHSGNPKLGFVSQIKLKIDIARGGRGDWGRLYPGKVVMMGSHQQNVRQLFKSTEPLFQRQDVTLRLRQWTLPTIMEMASQQGILIDPKKFLILWAAYGGMPHHWHRYCTSKKYSHLHEMSDIKEWRSAFLTAEKITLESNSEERFDTKAYMEFPDIQRGILLHIGRNKPQGDQLRGFSSNLRDKATLDRALDQLLDLELIDIKTPFYADGPERWCISDNNALFQIMVFREIIKLKGATKRDENPTPPDMDTLVRRMETLEGGVMERMAETWLKTQDNVIWCNSNIWRSVTKENEKGERVTLNLEIDVMASNKGQNLPMVWLGSAKRDPERHRPQQVIKDQDLFLQELGDGEAGIRLREKSVRRRFLFSPFFTPEHRVQNDRYS